MGCAASRLRIEWLEVQRQIQNGAAIANAGGVTIPECGPGPWLQIANFDFASTSPPCPTEWEPISLGSGFGGCRRPETAAGCSVALLPLLQVESNTARYVGELLEQQLPVLMALL